MNLFIDECLSPTLVQRLAEAGHWAIHPRDYSRTGELDHQVLQRCLDQDLTIVTENAGDPADVMINHVLEVDDRGNFTMYSLVKGD